MKKFFMTGNNSEQSVKVKENIVEIAKKFDMHLSEKFDEDCLFNICVGGDGAFIHAIHNLGFPNVPFIGVNTGHLGFYQELLPENIEDFFISFNEKRYNIEKLAVLESKIKTEDKEFIELGINELSLKGKDFRAVHLEIFIADNFLEHFFGDGVIISTPVGSTAYNFSLGGSIVYPSLNTMQLAPVSPITNKVYRSLINSIVVPGNTKISIDCGKNLNPLSIIIDGEIHPSENIQLIESSISEKTVKKIVLSDEIYWNNLRDKIL